MQFSKIKFGFPAVVCTALLFISGEAHTQYVGSSAQPQADPQQSTVSMRAAVLSQDPFDGVNFMVCEMAGADGSGGTMGDSFSSAADVLKGGGSLLAKDASCSADVPGTVDASCDSFNDAAGSFSESKLDEAIQTAKGGAALARCKARKAQSGIGMMDCFTQQFKRMKQDMEEVRKDFDNQLLATKNNVSKLNAEVEKERQKQGKLDGKIASFKETMAKINMALDRAHASDSTGGSIGNIQKEINAHEAQVRNFEREILNDRPRRVARCFQNGGSLRSKLINCKDANGHIQAPKECVLRLYHDGVYLENTKGSNVNSPAAARNAEQARTTFSEQLDRMMAAMSGQEPMYKSVNALLNSEFGSLLKTKGKAGQAMMDELKNCDWDAENGVKNDLANPKTPLGAMKEALASTAGSVSSRLREIVQGSNGLNTALRDASRELVGREMNSGFTGNCNSTTVTSNSGEVDFRVQPLRQQMKCAEYLVQTLTVLRDGGILPGTTMPLKVPLSVPGLNGQPAFCENLRDCDLQASDLKAKSVTRMEGLQGGSFVADTACPINVSSLYQVAPGSASGCPGIKRLTDDTNRAIESAFKQAAEMFKQRVAVARMQLEKVKKSLGLAGLDLPEAGNGTAEGLNCPDAASADSGASELCKLPNPFGEALAKAAGAPGLLDTDFDAVKKEARQKQGENNGLATKLDDNAKELAKAKTVCKKKKKKEELATGTSKVRSGIEDALSMCDDIEGEMSDFNDKIASLSKDLTRVCEKSGDPNDGCDELRTKLRTTKSKCNKIVADASRQKMMFDTMARMQQPGSAQGLQQPAAAQPQSPPPSTGGIPKSGVK